MDKPIDEQVTQIAQDMEGLSPGLVNSKLETLAIENPMLYEAVSDRLNCSTIRRGNENQTNAQTQSEQIRIQPSSVMTGMRLGSCVLGRLIAEGGMGAVYEGRQDPLGRQVAIKLMKSGLISNEARQRFSYEARLLGNLAHPGIAQIFESGVCEVGAGGVAIPYIVMELVPEARTLSAFVRDERLSIREICELYLTICDAVTYAHQHGIIHRDLKPANILVDKDGRPRVIDFGVAHVDDDGFVTRSFETDANSIVGTLPYMSPEQVGDGESVDVRSDEYTLGVIFYELLCGQRPYDFDGRSLPQAIDIIKGVAPTRPSSLKDDLAGDLETIILKTLRKDRSERYQSVDDFADDIRSFLAGLPVQARPTSMAYQARLFARRNKTLVLMTTTFVICLIGATVFSVIQAADARSSARAAKSAAAVADDRQTQALRLLAETRSFSEWLIIDLLNEVSLLPGSTPLTEKIAKRVATHLDSMADDATIDPEVQRSISLAYMEIGAVLGSPTRPNLGRPDEALEYLEKAEAGFKVRWQEDPTPRRTLDLCVVQSVLADVRLIFGQADQAQVLFVNGLERLESMKPDGDLTRKRDAMLAVYRRDYGAFLANHGEVKKGIDLVSDAIELRQEILAGGEYTAADQRQFNNDVLTLAQIYSANGLAAKAESTLRPMVEGAKARAQDGMLEAGECASILFQLADALSVQKGKEKEALELFMEVLAIREGLSERDANNISRLENLATILERCSTLVMFVEQDAKKSLALIERTETAARQIVRMSPDSVAHKSRLRIVLGLKGATLNILQEKDAALEAAEESFQLAEDIYLHSPQSQGGIRAMGEAWTLRGHVWVSRSGANSSGDEMLEAYQSAQKCYAQGKEFFEKLTGGPDEPFWVAESLRAQKAYMDAASSAVTKLRALLGK
ncbi:MAG: tetratricopeptide (TPR) repeat protein [Planctomycetota bacterium]|jgi:tetratricopeptide (TPR) repeat protein